MIVFLDGVPVPMCERCHAVAREKEPVEGTTFHRPLTVDAAIEAGWRQGKRISRGSHRNTATTHLCATCKTAPPKKRARRPDSLKVPA